MEGNDFRIKRVYDAQTLNRKWLGGQNFQAALGLAPAGEKGSYAATLTELEDEPKEWVRDISVEVVGAGCLTCEYMDVPAALPALAEEEEEGAVSSAPPSALPQPTSLPPPAQTPVVSGNAEEKTAAESGLTQYPWEQLEEQQENGEEKRAAAPEPIAEALVENEAEALVKNGGGDGSDGVVVVYPWDATQGEENDAPAEEEKLVKARTPATGDDRLQTLRQLQAERKEKEEALRALQEAVAEASAARMREMVLKPAPETGAAANEGAEVEEEIVAAAAEQDVAREAVVVDRAEYIAQLGRALRSFDVTAITFPDIPIAAAAVEDAAEEEEEVVVDRTEYLSQLSRALRSFDVTAITFPDIPIAAAAVEDAAEEEEEVVVVVDRTEYLSQLSRALRSFDVTAISFPDVRIAAAAAEDAHAVAALESQDYAHSEAPIVFSFDDAGAEEREPVEKTNDEMGEVDALKAKSSSDEETSSHSDSSEPILSKLASPPSSKSATAAAPAPAADANTIVFKVTSQLTPGEYLMLVGSVAELGRWNADKGIPMKWSEGNVWTAYVDASSKGIVVPVAGAAAAVAAAASSSVSSSSSPTSSSTTPSSVVEFKLVRVNERSGLYTWLEGENYRVELARGEVVSMSSVDASKNWVQGLSVEIVATADVVLPESDRPSAEDDDAAAAAAVEEEEIAFQAEVEAARQAADAKEAQVKAKVEDVESSAETQSNRGTEDVGSEGFVDALVYGDSSEREQKSDEDAEHVDTALLSDGAMAVVEAMRSAKKEFEEAAAAAAAAVSKADTAMANLRATDKSSSGEDVYLAAKAAVDSSSRAAFEAVDAAKKAKEQVAAATSAVASLAADDAALAEMEAKAAAKAASADAAGDEAVAAEAREKEVAAAAAKAANAADAKNRADAAAELSREEAAALAKFEFPEFDLPDVDKRTAGAAVIGGLGLAVGVAEADLASSLMQVGGEAMMTTLFAFVFANNMVFKKDRDKLVSSFDSRETFENFWLSGAWTGKDSIAGRVAKDAWEVFDPLGINGSVPNTTDESMKSKKSTFKSEPDSDLESGSSPAAAADDDDEVGGDDDASEKDAVTSSPRATTWDSDASISAYLALNPTVASLESQEAAASGRMPVSEAFLSFSTDPSSSPSSSSSADGGGGGGGEAPSFSSSSSAAPSTDDKSDGPKPTSGSESGSESPSRSKASSGSGAGASSALNMKKNDKLKKKLPPVKKDVEAAEAAAAASGEGVPYTSWMDKNKEDLSTLTWQELAERMKKPEDPSRTSR